MGQKLSILAQTTPYIDVSSYINIIEDLQFIKNLNNNSKFISTNKCASLSHPDTEIITKVFIKPEQMETSSGDRTVNNDPLNINLIIQNLEQERALLKDLKNVIHYSHILNLSRAAYLFRPYLYQTLDDRISPHNLLNNRLELIELRFFLFQIIKSLSQIHAAGVIHGNITPRNILITSMDTVVFSDFSYYLKPFYLPEDNPNEYDFYFGRATNADNASLYDTFVDSSNSKNGESNAFKINDINGIKLNVQKTSATKTKYGASKGFYLAPERLDTQKQKNWKSSYTKDENESLSKCDIFSFGCIVFEVLSMFQNNTQKLYTFQEIFKFKSGDTGLFEEKLNSLDFKESFYLEIIRDCCRLNPNKRLSCEELLKKYRGTFFPECFYTDIYDDVIGCLNDFDNLTLNFQDFCGGLEKKCESIGYPIIKKSSAGEENEVFEDSEFITFANSDDLLVLQHFKELNNDENQCVSTKSALIYIRTFCRLLMILDSVKDILLCLDCIIIMSQYVPDTIKLDLVLPQLLFFGINGTHHTCNTFAFKKIVQLLSILDDNSSDSLNDSLCYYVFPQIQKALSNSSLNVECKLAIINILPKLLRYCSKVNKSLKKTVVSILGILLIEDDTGCKIALLDDIPDLVEFVGKTVTTDLILSHLITYLNESSLSLKVALLNCLCRISSFLGQISFQEFILPLLLQNLYLLPKQEFLILSALKNLHKLITDEHHFTIDKRFTNFKVFVEEHLMHFLLLPNQKIKEVALQILKTIVIDRSDLTERYCLYYPILKPFFHMTMEINEQMLHHNCRKNITKEQFKYLFAWGTKHDAANSLFWKEKSGLSLGALEFQYNNYADPDTMNQFLSMEDKLYIAKFVKTYKLATHHVWKLAKLRKYIKRTINNVSLNLKNEFIDYEKESSEEVADILKGIIAEETVSEANISLVDYSISFIHSAYHGNGKRNNSMRRRNDSAKLISQKLLNDALRNVNNADLEEINGSENNNMDLHRGGEDLITIKKTAFIVEKEIKEVSDANVLAYIESIDIKPTLEHLRELSYSHFDKSINMDVSPKQISSMSNFDRICDYDDCIDTVIANDKYLVMTTKNGCNKHIVVYDLFSFNAMNITKHDLYLHKIDLSLYTESDGSTAKIHEFKLWNDDVLVVSLDNGMLLILKILDDLKIGLLNKTKLVGAGEYGHIIKCTAEKVFVLTTNNRFFEYSYIDNKLNFLFTWNSKVLEAAYEESTHTSKLDYEIIIDFIVSNGHLVLVSSANYVYVYDLEFMAIKNLFQLYKHRNLDSKMYLPLRTIDLYGSDSLVFTGGYELSLLLIFSLKELINCDDEKIATKSNIISANKVVLSSGYKTFTSDDLYDKFILKKQELGKISTEVVGNQQPFVGNCLYNFMGADENLIAFYDKSANDFSYIDLSKNIGEVLFSNSGTNFNHGYYKKYNLNSYLKVYYRQSDSARHQKNTDKHSPNNIVLARYIYVSGDKSMLIMVDLNGCIYCYN